MTNCRSSSYGAVRSFGFPRSDPNAHLTLAERIQRCSSWQELIALFYPGERWSLDFRVLAGSSDIYGDPVLARLYDALHEEERAAYLMTIVAELRDLVLNIPVGTTIVEAGCGPGRLLLGLAEDERIATRGYRFLGYDPSPEMIAIANEHGASSPEHSSVAFEVGTSSDPHIQGAIGNASLLISRNILSWVDDPGKECTLWAHTLPRGARIYIRDLRRDIPFGQFKRRLLECLTFKVRDVCLAFPPYCMLNAYLRALTPLELRATLENARFEVEQREIQRGVLGDCGHPELAEMLFIGTVTGSR